jgi:protease-4
MRFLSTLLASALGTLLAFGVVLLFLFFFFFAFALSADPEPPVSPGSVLTLDLSGPIPERVTRDPFAQAFTDQPSYDLHDVKQSLRKAAADTRIDAVLIRAHGVTAPWAVLQEIRHELETFKASGKPLIASTGEYYSGEQDYFLNSAADSVFAAPEGFFEFNGFATQVAFFQNTLDQLEIDVQVVRAGDYKSAVEPFTREDLSAENREQLSALLDTTSNTFMRAVANSRGLSMDALNRIASEAATLTARGAYEANLIDGLLYEDEVRNVINRRLNLNEDEELSTITLANYARVSPSSAGLELGDEGEVAVVYAEGQIVTGDTDNMFGSSPMIGSETFTEAMQTARESDRTDAVVVRINSPGGSASASDAMWRAMELTAQQKPVIVSMGGTAASGGYWMATAADSIVADPLTITGSIGVFGVFFDASGLFESKLGVTFDGVQTSPYADIFTGLTDFSAEERALLERFIDETYRTFLEKVAASRNKSVEEVQEIAQGRVWSGNTAYDIGLVDVLGGLDTAIEIAASRAGLDEGTYRVRTLPRPKTFIERFNESLYAQATSAWQSLTLSSFERHLIEQQRTLHDLVRTHGSAQARLPYAIDVR